MFDISIIIPVYKSKSTVKKAIESVVNQKFTKFTPKIEIILSIDDCKNYKELITPIKQNISIKHIYTKKIKSGPGNARNTGFYKSSGKFIGFLDSDDLYSKNYLEKMIKNIYREKILTAPTHIYKDLKKIDEYNVKSNFLHLNNLIDYPCSFHPFMERNLFKDYELKPSQDIYNLAQFLNQKKIKIITEAYYILNLRENSITQDKCFQHKITQAYKYYLIRGIKENEKKISQHFAKRLIINRNFNEWKIKKDNKKTSYYEFIRRMRCT